MRFISLYTARHIPESEGCAGRLILFMKIHVGTVHLVTSSQKICHKEGLGLLVVISETAAF